jgi:predicted kinase
MVHASLDADLDELSLRTLPTFFGALELLLKAGVTTVAEAAFQDRLWRHGLEPLRPLARLRIVHCTVSADVALGRTQHRWDTNPVSRAHGGRPATAHNAFDRVSVDAPWTEVDTTKDYTPGLDEILAFISS